MIFHCASLFIHTAGADLAVYLEVYKGAKSCGMPSWQYRAVFSPCAEHACLLNILTAMVTYLEEM